MHIDEGGLPTGGLSNDVSRVFAERARQEAEVIRLKDIATQVQLEQFIQVTSPLRNHLLQLVAPIDELLSRFKVRELLEEAQNIFNFYEPKDLGPGEYTSPGYVKDRWYPTRRKDYLIKVLAPPIYQQVVSDPQLTEFFQLERGTVDLNIMVDPNSFRKMIPQLEGYGLALSSGQETHVRTTVKRQVWEPAWVESGYSGPEHYTYTRSPAHWGWDYFPAFALARVIKSMQVEAVRTESGAPGYDLLYSHQIRREDLSIQEDDHSLDQHVYLTPPIKVSSNDSVEVLKRLICDDIVRELDGEHEELFYKFVNWGITRDGKSGLVWVQ